jgi:hypothetical protein
VQVTNLTVLFFIFLPFGLRLKYCSYDFSHHRSVCEADIELMPERSPRLALRRQARLPHTDSTSALAGKLDEKLFSPGSL